MHVSISPSATYETIYSLVEQQLRARSSPLARPTVTPEIFDLYELQILDGGRAKPASPIPLHETWDSHPLANRAIFLREKKAATVESRVSAAEERSASPPPRGLIATGRRSTVSFSLDDSDDSFASAAAVANGSNQHDESGFVVRTSASDSAFGSAEIPFPGVLRAHVSPLAATTAQPSVFRSNSSVWDRSMSLTDPAVRAGALVTLKE
jgi:hypothetical protein